VSAAVAARAWPCEVLVNEPLAPKVSIRVGGAAEAYARPGSPDALVALLALARDEGLPLTVLGGGANTLVGDGGVEGLTVKLPADLFPEQVERFDGGARLTLGGGAAIARLVQQMKVGGLVGAEFLAGIPGTLGGAVTMNAGTKHGECMSVVEAVELATPDGLGWVQKDALSWHYRHTELPAGAVVSRVRFLLREGDVTASQEAMEKDLGYRKRTQPLSWPNMGSVFKNPPGDHAGRLIEAVGLKGHTVGKAQITTLHANWIVNLGGATARDVVALVTLAQERVRAQFGIELQPEVKRVGRF
jgi:UDP-N-acetylmuramate dehydrogenase